MASKPKPVSSRAEYLVYSTMTCGTDFVEYDMKQGEMPVVARRVRINGGAGLAQKKTLVTPLGVATQVSHDDMEFLLQNDQFKHCVETGYITHMKATGWQSDPDAVAADMAQRDGSAPFVPADYEESKRPSSGKGAVQHSRRGNNQRFDMANRVLNRVG